LRPLVVVAAQIEAVYPADAALAGGEAQERVGPLFDLEGAFEKGRPPKSESNFP
jgi:hypothetical protein